jgi:lipopolysaccharide export system protein LptC
MPAVARYTLFVALSKRFLWILVAGIIALVVWIASDNSADNKARLVFSNIAQSSNLQNLMSNPHFQGVDAQNRPYTVTATKATQLDEENISMEQIRADMNLGTGAWIAMDAGTGLMNMKTKQLELHDGIDLFYQGGYEFRTSNAQVDIQKGNAYGESPVEGQGPLGTLKANSFQIVNQGQRIVFNGSVRMKLYH